MFGQAEHVFFGLLDNPAQGAADFLGLDHAGRPAGDEQQLVAGPGRQRELAHRHAQGGSAVEVVAVLHDPAGGAQQGVDGLPGELFGGFQGQRLLFLSSERMWAMR